MGYLANFMVYTLAMVGVIVIALMVFKSATGSVGKGTSKFLKVHDTLSAGEEKFLIAGDVDKTSLISKLNSNETNIELSHIEQKSLITNDFKTTMENLNNRVSYMDRKKLGIQSSQERTYESVIKNLAAKLKN